MMKYIKRPSLLLPRLFPPPTLPRLDKGKQIFGRAQRGREESGGRREEGGGEERGEVGIGAGSRIKEVLIKFPCSASASICSCTLNLCVCVSVSSVSLSTIAGAKVGAGLSWVRCT